MGHEGATMFMAGFEAMTRRLHGDSRTSAGHLADVTPIMSLPVPKGEANTHLTVSTYVDWYFIDPPVAVRPTLDQLLRIVEDATADISRVAGL